MTAAVPVPRFRDQLAEELDDVLIDIRRRIAGVFAPYMVGGAPNTLACELADEAIPDSYWDAEVEARVQASANQRAVEALRAMAAELSDSDQYVEIALGGAAYVQTWLSDRADALAAEPVSAPQSVVNVHPRHGHETVPVSPPTAATAPALPIPVEPTE